jgi:2-keto-4-pentenoate hydratase/2-oxohepta-3-ene-1,7-dioic acid hydratase in catechol pathway
MKLVRHGAAGHEATGLIDATGTLRDLSGHVSDIDSAALAAGALDRIRAVDPASLPVVDPATRLGPPVAGVGKIVCVGLNYTDHAKEAGLPIPDEPLLFFKAPSAISGPSDPVLYPVTGAKLDWEVELAFVIGKRARHVGADGAADHIAGYMVLNDVSERGFQLERGGQWGKGKSYDTFCPIGPWLVTPDEVPDPHALGIWLEVNGRRFQDGNTANMIFSVGQVMAHITELMTLLPGDIVTTGTPPGVGLGVKPDPVFLQVGDVMRLGIDGLGEQRQTVVADEAGP